MSSVIGIEDDFLWPSEGKLKQYHLIQSLYDVAFTDISPCFCTQHVCMYVHTFFPFLNGNFDFLMELLLLLLYRLPCFIFHLCFVAVVSSHSCSLCNWPLGY